MAEKGFQVKGSIISSKLDLVAERFGVEAANTLAEELVGVPARRVLASSWYPFEVYDRLIATIVERFYDGRLEAMREIGAYSAKTALTGTYRALARGKCFADFVRHLSSLHGTIYSHGRTEVDEHVSGIRFAILDLPSYSKAEAEINLGYLEAAAELLDGKPSAISYRLVKGGVEYQIRL